MARPSRKVKPAAQRSLLASLDWGVLQRACLAIAWIGLVAGLAVGWAVGLPHLRGYAASAAAPRTTSGPGAGPIRVEVRDLPTWLQGDPAIDLELLVRECVSSDPLDREGLVRAREALLATGWFESVAQVRRTGLHAVEVVGRFVDPAALVRFGGRDWLVDSSSRLLPMSWPSGDGPTLAVVLGVRSAPPRRAGEQWAGNDLAAALAVLAVVDRQPWAHQVSALDLAHFQRDRSVTLITDRETTIRWGRAPGTERGAEVSSVMKLDFLRHHHRRYGHIDGGLRGELDVTQDVAVVR